MLDAPKPATRACFCAGFSFGSLAKPVPYGQPDPIRGGGMGQTMTSTPRSSSARICRYSSRASDSGSLQLPQGSAITSSPVTRPLLRQQHSDPMLARLALQHAVEFAFALHQNQSRARRIVTNSKAGRFQRLRRTLRSGILRSATTTSPSTRRICSGVIPPGR